jgi:hypothetical protein
MAFDLSRPGVDPRGVPPSWVQVGPPAPAGFVGMVLGLSRLGTDAVLVPPRWIQVAGFGEPTLWVPLCQADGAPLVGVTVHLEPLAVFGSTRGVVPMTAATAVTDAAGVARFYVPLCADYRYRIWVDIDGARLLDHEVRVPAVDTLAPQNGRGQRWH